MLRCDDFHFLNLDCFFADESFILDPSNEEKTFAAKSTPQLLFKLVCRGIWFVRNSVLANADAYLTLLFSNYAQFCSLSEKTNDYEMYC